MILNLSLMRQAAVMLVLTHLACGASHAQETSVSEQAVEGSVEPRAGDDQLVLMHYMPWYRTPEAFGGRGGWGDHWTGWGKHDPSQVNAEGRHDVWSNYYPLIGPYDSADPHVLEAQLLQMRIAGVDGVIVDWYGVGEAADYAENQVASIALFKACERLGFSFAVCYEDRTIEMLIQEGEVEEDAIADHLVETIGWLNANWFRSPNYVRLDGRPLFLTFGPILVKDPAAWEKAMSSVSPRPLFLALHHLWRGVNADGGFTWVHPDAWKGEASNEVVTERLVSLHTEVGAGGHLVASATTGFDDVYENSFESLDHRNGDTLRASLDAALQAPGKVVQLVTWNDYGEGTMFEPTREFGYLFLEILQDRLADRLPAGVTADDLRLPAELLELRRAGVADTSALDEAADLLSHGKAAEARELLRKAKP